MLYTKSGFKKLLLEKAKREFDFAEITKEKMITVRKDNFEVSMEFEDVYKEYTLEENNEEFIDKYLEMLKSAIKNSFNINLGKVYPTIRHKSIFNNEKNTKFLREKFILDLEILYVEDYEDSFKFVIENDYISKEEVKEKAFANLNKITNVLAKLDNSMDIYSFKFNSEHCGALFLNENVKQQIRKKVGNNFLFAIPSPSTLFVAKNRIGYVDILQRLILDDPDPNKVSIRVYQYFNEKYSYADI